MCESGPWRMSGARYQCRCAQRRCMPPCYRASVAMHVRPATRREEPSLVTAVVMQDTKRKFGTPTRLGCTQRASTDRGTARSCGEQEANNERHARDPSDLSGSEALRNVVTRCQGAMDTASGQSRERT